MTRKQLRDLILTTTNRSDKSDVADAAIDLCMARVGQMNDWQQCRIGAPFPIVAGDQSIILPDGTRRIIQLRLINGTLSYEMALMDKTAALRRVPNPAAQPPGIPCIAYRETDASNNDTLIFIPTSNGAYSIELTIVLNPSIGPDVDSLCTVPDLDEAIVAFGSEYVFSSIAEWDQAAQWKARFAECVADAKAADWRRPGVRQVFERFGRELRVSASDGQYDPFVMG